MLPNLKQQHMAIYRANRPVHTLCNMTETLFEHILFFYETYCMLNKLLQHEINFLLVF